MRLALRDLGPPSNWSEFAISIRWNRLSHLCVRGEPECILWTRDKWQPRLR